MSKRNNFFGSKTSLSPRTIAFLAATGITDTTIANALNTMDLALIANGLDAKIQALYPYVGGTATTHKFNFMNPADTDAAYRITWFGGVTHDANGVTGNGLNGYGQTYWPLTAGNLYNRCFSFYQRTCASETKLNGYYDGSRAFSMTLNSSVSPKKIIYQGLNNASPLSVDYNFGFLAASIPSSAANAAFYFNISSVVYNITAGSSPTTGTMPTLAMVPAVGSYTSRNLAFEHYGAALTSAELITLSGIVTAFQTALSRNV
ncbi:MAG TPA: hypothetical protein PLY25_10185 [Bacteroidia bacterium]|nr:hypothetical protein [Bacteroidia bacterium]